jgi:hypothetical protein
MAVPFSGRRGEVQGGGLTKSYLWRAPRSWHIEKQPSAWAGALGSQWLGSALPGYLLIDEGVTHAERG